jgi:hypothetical protein
MGDEALYAAFVGPSWERHYRASFRSRDGRGRHRFNWAAALVPFWLAWRGFWLLEIGAFLVYSVLFGTVAGIWANDTSLWPLLAAPWILVGLVEGVSGDLLVYSRARRAIERAHRKGLEGDAALAAVRRSGGVSLLAPVVLTAVIAAFAITVGRNLFRHDYDAPRQAALKSDLRNLVVSEEAYFADHRTYTSTPQDSALMGRSYIMPSSDVTVTMGRVSATGWNATATNQQRDLVCGIFVGDAPAPLGHPKEGEPYCEKP